MQVNVLDRDGLPILSLIPFSFIHPIYPSRIMVRALIFAAYAVAIGELGAVFPAPPFSTYRSAL